MVLQFLSGLRKFSGYSSEVLNTLCLEKSIGDSTSDGESGDDPVSAVGMITFDTLHWLFEAQDESVIAELLGSSDIQLYGQRSVVTPFDWSSDIQLSKQHSQVTHFDCFVLGYCVSHSNCTWKIDLTGCHIGDKEVEMLVRGAVEEEAHCTGGISVVNVSENNITAEGVKYLLNLQFMNKSKTLALSLNWLDSESCAVLAHHIPHVPHLKKLDLSYNLNIGQGGAVPLILSLTAHNSLKQLLLGGTGIGVKDCRALSELLSSSTSLNNLGIGNNDLPPEAVELIISGLHYNTTLNELNMWCSHFSPQNTISLASVLRTNHTLVHLNLRECNIDSDGVCQLASALCTNDTLQVLYLKDNQIGVVGAIVFAEMLLKNKSLKLVSLRDDSIGEEGTQKLIDSLTHNTTVETLKLPKKYKSSITSTRVDNSEIYLVMQQLIDIPVTINVIPLGIFVNCLYKEYLELVCKQTVDIMKLPGLLCKTIYSYCTSMLMMLLLLECKFIINRYR